MTFDEFWYIIICRIYNEKIGGKILDKIKTSNFFWANLYFSVKNKKKIDEQPKKRKLKTLTKIVDVDSKVKLIEYLDEICIMCRKYEKCSIKNQATKCLLDTFF